VTNATERMSEPARRYRGWLHLLLGMAITIALLAWALRDVSFGSVWAAVRGARPGWLGLGLLAFLASFAVRAQRWGTLLGAYGDSVSFGLRQSAIYIGFAVNNLVPARVGEVTRALVLNRVGGVPLGVALGSIVAARLLDGIVVFLLLLASLALSASSGSLAGQLDLSQIVWIGGSLAAIAGAVLLAVLWPDRVSRLVALTSRVVGLGRFAPRLQAATQSLLRGLEVLRRPTRGLSALAQSIVLWGLTAVTYWSGMLAFGISGPGVPGAVFVMTVVALAIAIPSSPGQFGPYEAGIRLALSSFAIPSSTIVAYGITLHILLFVSVTTIGAALAVRLGLSWRRLARADFGNAMQAGAKRRSEQPRSPMAGRRSGVAVVEPLRVSGEERAFPDV
jgi:glycosyltransferase 2 family protein